MKARFDRQEYLVFEEIFEVGQLDDVTKELCEFSDDIEDMAYELAYTRYALAKCEARHSALVEAVRYHLELADQHDMEYLGTQDKTTGLLGRVISARAEVDRLINESAADCKGEG